VKNRDELKLDNMAVGFPLTPPKTPYIVLQPYLRRPAVRRAFFILYSKNQKINKTQITKEIKPERLDFKPLFW
jgi:hypothetical protein